MGGGKDTLLDLRNTRSLARWDCEKGIGPEQKFQEVDACFGVMVAGIHGLAHSGPSLRRDTCETISTCIGLGINCGKVVH